MPASCAILFKTYFFDDFVARRLQHLRACAGGLPITVCIDETRQPAGPVGHDRVLRITEQAVLSRGLEAGPQGGSLFWYCTDYPLYEFFLGEPDHDYYLTVEYDAVLNCDIAAFVGRAAAQGVDLIAQPLNVPIGEWVWTETCEQIYQPVASIIPCLESIALFSRRAVRHLYETRLRHSAAYRAGTLDRWPLAEGFLATELTRQHQSVGKLSHYGSVVHYDWWPPYQEADLAGMATAEFIHPVLDGARFVNALLGRLGATPSHFIDAKGLMGAALRRLPPEVYLPRLLGELERRESRHAFDGMRRILAQFPEPGPNIALGRHATQSSISQWSRHQGRHRDASVACNDDISGAPGFHTDDEAHPWWMMDLEWQHRLQEIRVYNVTAHPGRARSLQILTSDDGRSWDLLYQHEGEAFGGVESLPLIVAAQDRTTRFVRLELAEGGYLHLDEIQIFGERA